MNVEPESPSRLQPARTASLPPAVDEVLQRRMQAIGRRLFVLSGKGGVGKSTVAVNLAVALARRGRRVGLLDVDVHGPSVPTLLHVPDSRVLSDDGAMLPIPAGENLKVLSLGFLTRSPDDAVVWRGPLKYSAIRQFLRDVAWGELDELVIDCPPGTGDEPLSVVQLAGTPAAAVIVTTPQTVAVADVRRCTAFCRLLKLPIAGLIENMSGFVCPHCGAVVDVFGHGGADLLARESGVSVLGRIPLDPEIRRGGDAGTPFAAADGAAPAPQAFREIVDRLLTFEPAPP